MRNKADKDNVHLNKDDFLFEIEDKRYLFYELLGFFIATSLYIVLLFMFDFNIKAIIDSGRLGAISMVVLPFYFYKVLTLALYIIKKDSRKKIRFYTTHIYKNKKKDGVLYLKDIKEAKIGGYFYSITVGRFKTKLKFFVTLIFGFTIGLPIFFHVYIIVTLINVLFFKRYFLNDVYIQTNNNDSVFKLFYEMLDEEDRKKVEDYFKTYANLDLNSLEKKSIYIPAK